MRPLFAADSIAKSFGSRRVLTTASIWGTEGRVTALFGRNGCGKSTLLRIAAGVMRADVGAVHFDGKCYLRPRLHQLAARGLFYLPQEHLLSDRWTLGDHLAALRWRFGDRSQAIVEELGLGEVINHRPGEMSGGQRRLAELALAWVRQPRCLLADEPFIGVNPATGDLVANVLRRMAEEGCAVVVTGHEVRELMSIADEVVWMVAGTTHGIGTPAAAGRHDQFRREYLGPGRLI